MSHFRIYAIALMVAGVLPLAGCGANAPETVSVEMVTAALDDASTARFTFSFDETGSDRARNAATGRIDFRNDTGMIDATKDGKNLFSFR